MSPDQPSFMNTAQGYATPSVNAPYASPSLQRAPSQPHLHPHLHQADHTTPAAPMVHQPVFTSTPTSVLAPSKLESTLLRGKLKVMRGEQQGEIWFLNRVQTSLGRALDNDLVLLDISSSRKHVQIMRHALGFTLLDLRSANGVYINGRRVSEEELYDGDEIEIGETLMRFEMVGTSRERIVDEDDTSPGIERPPSSSSHQPVRQPHSVGAQSRALPAQHPMGNHSLLTSGVPHQVVSSGSSASSSRHQVQPSHYPNSRPQSNAHVAHASHSQSRVNDQSLRHVSSGQTNHHTPQTPQSSAHHISQSSYNPAITYGFGSQMSPAELNLSPAEQSYYTDQGLDQRAWSQVWRDKVDAWSYEMRFGVGRRALIIRSTSILMALLCFFALGLLMSRASSMWSSEPSIKPKVVSNAPEVSLSDLEHQKHLSHVSNLVNQRLWSKALAYLNTNLGDPQHTKDLRVKSLYAEVESEMIRAKVPEIQRAIQRGQLKKAIKDFAVLYDHLSDDGKTQVSHLDYALWLYQRELKRADRINPPPTEQTKLERAAQSHLQGDQRGAKRLLLRLHTTNKSRQALVKLRIEAVSKIRDSIRRAELSYLLGQANDTQVMLQTYNDAINRGMQQTNYKAISPWINGALRLAVGTPSMLVNLKDKKGQLEREARKWLSNARKIRKSQPPQARALLEAAIPYLKTQEAKDARSLLRTIY
jgi:hypothetical protein